MYAFDHSVSKWPVGPPKDAEALSIGQDSQRKRRETQRLAARLPPALAFLPSHGVPPQFLLHALHEGAYLRERTENVLLASGRISEQAYYRALARHLGLPFLEALPKLHESASFPQTLVAGVAPVGRDDVKAADSPDFIFAPRGRALGEFLVMHRRGHLPRGRHAITTPAILTRHLMQHRAEVIAARASDGLPDLLGDAWSAKRWTSRRAAAVLLALGLLLGTAWWTAGMLWSLLCLLAGHLFAGFTSLRLVAVAASCKLSSLPAPQALNDPDLPVYSVIVALYREAASVRALTAALARLDYPKSRLDMILVVEADDAETLRALEALALPAHYRILVAPPGVPRTKPRALNIALPLVRGAYVCVFDAEDIPEPGQLREAADCFAAVPVEVACLQGRLCIDNGGDGWLARCFSFEYAALFDVLNPGLAILGAPLPLGGTSNHFRTSILRKIGGWDSWNVTEDIDLGMRLARFGYAVGVLASSTREEAPAQLGAWMRQRRRWFKGWIQTLLVHGSTPLQTMREMGPARATAAFLTVSGTLAGAFLGPVFVVLALVQALYGGLLRPAGPADWVIATLACFVSVTGLASAIAPLWLGVKRRRMRQGLGCLALMPAYWMLMTVAAWWAAFDFLRDPFNWLKTEHGRARRRMGAGF